MPKKPLIAVDIDDVLSHTTEKILAFSNERWGHHNTLEEFTEDLASMWQVDREEANRRWGEFMNSGAFERFEVIPDAKAALAQLKQRYTLWAVTSRRESLLPVTVTWLEASYPGIIDEVVSAGIYGKSLENAHQLTKAEILQKIGADYLIDDQPKHCVGAAGAGIPSVLFGNYPWQSGIEYPEVVTRCKNWQEVVRYFDER